MTKLNISDLNRFFLGFDRIDSQLLNNLQYPVGSYTCYNIIKVGDTGYRLEVALPGWNIEDIDVTLDKNVLKVEGTSKQVQEENEVF
ncbi:MAG: Hsp20 family protein, partial [bacterium]